LPSRYKNKLKSSGVKQTLQWRLSCWWRLLQQRTALGQRGDLAELLLARAGSLSARDFHRDTSSQLIMTAVIISISTVVPAAGTVQMRKK
jgi:hypothetical protein